MTLPPCKLCGTKLTNVPEGLRHETKPPPDNYCPLEGDFFTESQWRLLMDSKGDINQGIPGDLEVVRVDGDADGKGLPSSFVVRNGSEEGAYSQELMDTSEVDEMAKALITLYGYGDSYGGYRCWESELYDKDVKTIRNAMKLACTYIDGKSDG